MRFASMLLLVTLGLGAGKAMAMDGSSGCGPAWYVFKENSIVSSALRAITNGTLSPIVTLGETFGTSNCAKHTLVMNDKQSLEFASKSFDVLRQDIAKGRGEYLNAYISSFGCNELVRPQLSSQMQSAFKEGLYRSENPADYVESTRMMIEFSSAKGLCS